MTTPIQKLIKTFCKKVENELALSVFPFDKKLTPLTNQQVAPEILTLVENNKNEIISDIKKLGDYCELLDENGNKLLLYPISVERKIIFYLGIINFKDNTNNILNFITIYLVYFVEKYKNEIYKSKLLEKDNLFNAVIENFPNPFFYKDNKGKYLGCNNAFSEFIGYKYDDIVGKSVKEVSPTALSKVYKSKDNELLQSKGKQFYKTQVKNRYGQYQDVIMHKSTFDDANGETAGIVGALIPSQSKKLNIDDKLDNKKSIGKILIMDDEENILDILKRACEKMGYDVYAVTDGAQAYTEYEKHLKMGEKFDVAILDVTIPYGMGAIETTEAIRKIDSNAKIVVTSGFEVSEVVNNLDKYGINKFLKKPFKLKEIEKLLSGLVSR